MHHNNNNIKHKIMNITLAQAEKAIATAKQKSTAIDTKMNIAIVDA